MPLISPNFDVKSILFSNFGQGPFPKKAGKSPVVSYAGDFFNILSVIITRNESEKPILHKNIESDFFESRRFSSIKAIHEN